MNANLDPFADETTQRRSADRPKEAPDADLVAIYLRQMSATPLLDREGEVALATELHEARKEFAAQVRKLPAACRKQVMPTKTNLPAAGELWGIEAIESCHQALVHYRREHPDLARNVVVQRLLRTKQRVDRSRNAMVQANLRLVAHVAKNFGNQGLPYIDLIQEGNLGLLKAVEKFDHRKGYKFSTYAFWWIKQAITRALDDKSRTIRIPVHIGEKLKKIKRAAEELESKLGRTPTAKEVSRKADIPLGVVKEFFLAD